MTMQLLRAFSIRSRQSMCMIAVMSHGQRPGRAFSNISKCSIIGTGGIQPWDTGHRYHLSWRLWQPNLTECPQNQGKTTIHKDMSEVKKTLKERYQLIFDLGTRCGLRISEILQIRPEDLLRPDDGCYIQQTIEKGALNHIIVCMPTDLYN